MQVQLAGKLPVQRQPKRSLSVETEEEGRGSMVAAGYIVLSALVTGTTLLILALMALVRLLG